MEATAIFSDNITQNFFYSRYGIVMWTTLAITLLLFLGVFLFVAVLLLHAFFTIAHLRKQLRYILFMYILVNNTINLLTSMFLFLLVIFACKIPAGGCCFVVGMASSTFYNTPNGLAAMAIDRYIAICFPLRHSQICQAERTWMVVLLVSGIGILPMIIEMLILISNMDYNFFLRRVWCFRESVFMASQQAMLRYSIDGLNFTVVALIILYTYLKIMREAKKIGEDNASSSKASKTVMLHAFQLLLSLTSFTAGLSESLTENESFHMRFLNFFMFMVLPIFLSPLIYGLRDDTFGKHIKKFFLCPRHGNIP